MGCRFVLLDPLPTDERPTGLTDALRSEGISSEGRVAGEAIFTHADRW